MPFYDPTFGDTGQVIDPLIYAGWLAAVTTDIAIGTAGIVLPLRDPLSVGKQASSIDQLLGGRLVFGLASGDRPAEYPAFGAQFSNRAERYRNAYAMLRSVTEDTFPQQHSTHYGVLDGALDLVPKPVGPRLPMVAIGRAGQTIDWIGSHMDGWIWHGRDARTMSAAIPQWRAATGDNSFKPYGYSTFFELDENPDAPIEHGSILRSGRNALIEFWQQQEQSGISHVALNLKPTRRETRTILDELAEYVLPHFPSHSVGSH